ncbi:hypothetical protein JZO70_08105 [Enterococcus sp. 669A]|uniref:Uncharacterized protein n=1 Tax=Candidatus Enterococcus moelleringii TaxID=2815325 RepID=A0ABS3LBJ9_9ENTE|nr:hypothetical protein [Enterococcus sp. 669A]MBO1306121.1 hypothetical protein [Enterococcus sp. 669A]
MTIPIWLGIFAGIAVIGLVSFLLFFIKDSNLRVTMELKPMVLLVDCGLLFVALLAVGAAIFLYLNWQTQLNFFSGS